MTALRSALSGALGALPFLAACSDTMRGEARLEVSPTSVSCAAGDAVRIAATVSGVRASGFAFAVDGDAVWLDDVQRDRGAATILCRAVGSAVVTIDAAGRSVPVPVLVQRPPAGTLRVTVAPTALAMLTGTTAYVEGRVETTRAAMATDVRYSSLDTTIAVVDSLFGLVRPTRAGTTSIIATARADRTVFAAATVVVTRSSSLVSAIIPMPGELSLGVGDSARVSGTVILARTAPPGTSTAVTFATSDPTVARIAANGTVRAVGQGFATVYVAPVVAPLLRAPIAVTVGVPAP